LGSGIRDPDPGSRGQKGTGSRIPDPDPQHWSKASFIGGSVSFRLYTISVNIVAFSLTVLDWRCEFSEICKLYGTGI
jgi:hypothetical protein